MIPFRSKHSAHRGLPVPYCQLLGLGQYSVHPWADSYFLNEMLAAYPCGYGILQYNTMGQIRHVRSSVIYIYIRIRFWPISTNFLVNFYKNLYVASRDYYLRLYMKYPRYKSRFRYFDPCLVWDGKWAWPARGHLWAWDLATYQTFGKLGGHFGTTVIS